MKRLIIAQIKIELDDSTDYGAASINQAGWATIISDYLGCSEKKIRDYCSVQIDETKSRCTCIKDNSMSQMECRIHGISAQLDRTQME